MKNNKIFYIATLALSVSVVAQQIANYFPSGQVINVWTWAFAILGVISGIAGLMGKNWAKKLLIVSWAVGLITTVLGGQYLWAAFFAVMFGLSFVFG